MDRLGYKASYIGHWWLQKSLPLGQIKSIIKTKRRRSVLLEINAAWRGGDNLRDMRVWSHGEPYSSSPEHSTIYSAHTIGEWQCLDGKYVEVSHRSLQRKEIVACLYKVLNIFEQSSPSGKMSSGPYRYKWHIPSDPTDPTPWYGLSRLARWRSILRYTDLALTDHWSSGLSHWRLGTEVYIPSETSQLSAPDWSRSRLYIHIDLYITQYCITVFDYHSSNRIHLEETRPLPLYVTRLIRYIWLQLSRLPLLICLYHVLEHFVWHSPSCRS